MISRHAPIGILLNHLEQLKGLKHLACHVLGPYAVVSRAYTVPLAASVDLGHGTNTSTSTEVQVANCGCCGSTRDDVTSLCSVSVKCFGGSITTW